MEAQWVRAGAVLTATWGHEGMWRSGPGREVFARRRFSRSFEIRCPPHSPAGNLSKAEVVPFSQV